MTSAALTPEALRRRAEVLAWQEKSPPDGPGETGGPDALAQTLYELRVHQIELEMQNEELRQFRLDLDASRERFFDFYDMAPVGYCTVNDKGTVIEANLTTAKLLGVPRARLIKKPFTRFIEPADQDIFYLMQKQLIQTKVVQICELRLRQSESEPFWVSLMASAVPTADQGAVMRIVLNQIDERKRISDALNASEARLRLMFDRATDGIVMLSGDGKLLAVNASFAQMHGYTQAEMTSLHLRDLDTPAAVQELPGLLKRVLAGETLNFEVTHFHKNGHIITLEVSSSLIVANGERLIQAFHRDITERKKSEETVRLAAKVFQNALEGIMITALDGSIIEVNDAFTEITGYSREEALGQNPRLLKSGRHDQAYYQQMWRGMAQTGIWVGENWNRRKNGEIYAQTQKVSTVRDEQGKALHYVSLFSDITAAKTTNRNSNASPATTA